MVQKTPLPTEMVIEEGVITEQTKPKPRLTYIVGAIVLFVFVSLFFLGKSAISQGAGLINPAGRYVTPTPTPKTSYSFLLMGMGGAGHEGGELTDTMLLANINLASKSATLINIPRDIWIPIQDKEGKNDPHKINFGYWLGGADEAKRLTETVTGIKPDYYAAVDFGSFVKIVDLLGGLDVQVPTTFVDDLYPITGKEDDPCGKTPEEIKQTTATLSGLLVDRQFPCRYEELRFEKGMVHMDGATALKFVRSRHAAIGGGDFARAARQQAVIVAFRNKLISAGSLPKLMSVANEAKKAVQTDIDFGAATKFAPALTEWNSYKIRNIIMSTDNVLNEGFSADRQYILTPKAGENNWDEVKKFIETESRKQ